MFSLKRTLHMRRIFVLEDDEGIREVLEMLLTSEDYLVESFSSVAEFMGRNIDTNPDLFLFDFRLQDGTGVEVLRRIRENERHSRIPAIIMSADASVEELEGIGELDFFICKPFEVSHLLFTVKAMIET